MARGPRARAVPGKATGHLPREGVCSAFLSVSKSRVTACLCNVALWACGIGPRRLCGFTGPEPERDGCEQQRKTKKTVNHVCLPRQRYSKPHAGSPPRATPAKAGIVLKRKDRLRNRAITNFRHSAVLCSSLPPSVPFYPSSLFLTLVGELPYFAKEGG